MKERQLITAIQQNNTMQLEQWFFGVSLDVNHRVGKYQDTLLHAAVSLKSIQVVEFTDVAKTTKCFIPTRSGE